MGAIQHHRQAVETAEPAETRASADATKKAAAKTEEPRTPGSRRCPARTAKADGRLKHR